VSVTRYPYKKIQQHMFDSVKELLESIDSDEDEYLNAAKFRAEVFKRMLAREEELKVVFEKKTWIHLGDVIELEDGTQHAEVIYDRYLETMFGTVMEDFNESNSKIVKKIYEFAETNKSFDPINLNLEVYYTDEDISSAKKKAKELILEYMTKYNVSKFTTYSRLPSFPDVFDKISWLEEELAK